MAEQLAWKSLGPVGGSPVVVAAGLAQECLVQVAYAIGVADPVSINVNTYGTGKVANDQLAEAIMKVFDLTPAGIVSRLKLKTPGFLKTAAYGHFGRDEFTWEKLDYVDEIANAVK